MTITVKIDEDTALDMLMDRLSVWTSDTDTIELFSDMYEKYIDDRVFDGVDFDVMVIVDNDYVNNCYTLERTEENAEDFDKLVAIYDDGYCYFENENITGSCIESVNGDKDYMLIRY